VDAQGAVRAVGPGVARIVAMTPDGASAGSCDVTVAASGAQPRRLASEATPFSDVPAGHWAAPAVNGLVAAGVVGGDKGAFSPDDDVTCAEFLKMAVLALEKAKGAEAAGVAAAAAGSQWYVPYVDAAKRDGLLDEAVRLATPEESDADFGASSAALPDGVFYPDAYLTRGDARAWLRRGFGVPGERTQAGYWNAGSDGGFLTRAAAAAILNDLMHRAA